MIGKVKVILHYCDLKHEIESIDLKEFENDLEKLSHVVNFSKIEIIPL